MKRKYVGIAGALLASLSAFVGGFVFYYLTGEIVEKREKQQELLSQRAELWESHMLADSRQNHAEIIFILASQWDDAELRLLADIHFFSAWRFMESATDNLPTGDLFTPIERWLLLTNAERKRMIDALRLESLGAMNSRDDEIHAIGQALAQLEGKASVTFYAGLVFTCIGGIIAALKDLS